MTKLVCVLCEHFKSGTICKLGYIQKDNENCIGYKKMKPIHIDKIGKATHMYIDEMENIMCDNMKAIGHESTEYLNCYDDFEAITKEMHELYLIKNKNYGNSFSKQFEEYGLTSVCIRLEDKLNRLKSLNKQLQDSQNGITNVNMDDESIKDTLIDLANYSVLAIMELNKGEE